MKQTLESLLESQSKGYKGKELIVLMAGRNTGKSRFNELAQQQRDEQIRQEALKQVHKDCQE